MQQVLNAHDWSELCRFVCTNNYCQLTSWRLVHEYEHRAAVVHAACVCVWSQVTQAGYVCFEQAMYDCLYCKLVDSKLIVADGTHYNVWLL